MKTEFYRKGKRMTVEPKRILVFNRHIQEKERVQGFVIKETGEEFEKMNKAFDKARQNLRKNGNNIILKER